MKRHHFSPDLAEKYGIAPAILMDTISYFIKANIQQGIPQLDGHHWCAKTLPSLHKMMPYCSISQIRTAIKKLETRSAILSAKMGKHASDQTKHYAIICPIAKKIYLPKSTDDHMPDLTDDHMPDLTDGYILSLSLNKSLSIKKDEKLNELKVKGEFSDSENSLINQATEFDNKQIICMVDCEIAKVYIRAELIKSCEIFDLKPPTKKSMDRIENMIYTKFRVLRFKDIICAINEAIDGNLGQTFKHYGQPLRYELILNTLRVYRSNHSWFFQDIIAQIDKLQSTSDERN